jgi:hypothetical protein
MFSKFRDLLWPLGATVLALFVVPIAIEQYPEVFKDSPWILPLGVLVVCLCWVIPLLVHDRVGRIHGWILGRLGNRIGLIAVVLGFVVAISVVSAFGFKLYGKHKRHLEARLQSLRPSVSNTSNTLPQSQPLKTDAEKPLEPTTAQRTFMVNLQKEYEDSIVTIRSTKLDHKGNTINHVDDTGFFVDEKGLILTTDENLRLPKEHCRRQFEVVLSDGTIRKPRQVGSTKSPYWRMLRINSTSKPLPLSSSPLSPGQLLIIMGKAAHPSATEIRLAKMGKAGEPFILPVANPAGFNGSPIFDENSEVVAVQVFRPQDGSSATCLKVPTKKFLVGMATYSE